jgi:hypothetical protein
VLEARRAEGAKAAAAARVRAITKFLNIVKCCERAFPAFGLLQMFLSIGWWELKVWEQQEGSTPGDFGIPYVDFYNTPEKQEAARAKELNNGRAAQMGILALMVHEKLDNNPYMINSLLGAPVTFN